MTVPKNNFWFLLLGLLLYQNISAQVVINEIMYDLPGTDTGREWVEIANTGSAVAVATSTWKFFEADTNHGLSLFQGSLSIPSGGFAIIADDPNKFLLDWPRFAGTIFDSSFSLSNTGETIALKSDTTTVSDQVTYASSAGATGDGNSLQKVGLIWSALPPSPGFANSNSAGNSATSSNQGADSSSSATTTVDNNSAAGDAASASNNNNSNWPVEPQIFSRIVGPTAGIAGADIIFKAEVVGPDKQPVANPRYVWNFGDGATKEGEAVLHSYNFPGEYVVILDASSGKWSSSSRLRMKIIAADLKVTGLVAGPDGKVELVNNSNQELDLSWWRLRSGNQFFTLPKNTKILAHGTLTLSSAVTGLNVSPRDVALLYPNGSIAYRYEAAPAAAASIAPAPAPKTLAPGRASAPAPSPSVSTVASSQKISLAATPLVTPPPTSQTAAAVGAFDEPSSADKINQPAETGARPSLSLWLYGALGIIVLGLGLALLPKPVKPKNPADEFEIIE
ncbi:MAG: lamin tail domain-containing protein [Candidatus Taylorbacteria bacterium]|nr:lamin tail domain-containing protein [Candidatus Taylorbacteria bacterium]